MTKEIELEWSDEDQKILKILKSGPFTYKEIAQKVYGQSNVFAIKHVYQAVGRIRKKSGIPFYPYMGPNTEVLMPKNVKDGEIVLEYVKKRSLGVVRGFMRTANYVDNHFAMKNKVSDTIQEFNDLLK